VIEPTVAFMTVCGGGEDYEFLLGAILHHAALGHAHVVLDTTPPARARRFHSLPPSVRWVHNPVYGHGIAAFRYVRALNDAIELAEATEADVICYLDADEYMDREGLRLAARLAQANMVEVFTLHHVSPHEALMVEGEWHRRLWPARRGVRVIENGAWRAHPDYNGNPEWHAFAQPPEGMGVIRADGAYHHHLHYAVGDKPRTHPWAESRRVMGGDPGADVTVPVSWPWPEPLLRWFRHGERPSEKFA
jgi:glycosyltransferase involved in cell wall biosynthesis